MFGVFRNEYPCAGCAVTVLVGAFASERLAQIALGRHLLALGWAQWSRPLWVTRPDGVLMPTTEGEPLALQGRTEIRKHVMRDARRNLEEFVIAPLPHNAFLATNHPAYIEVL